MTEPSRNIPVGVRKRLRQEVGFGCPVANCGNPYLTYHHFDPEWHVEHHHDPHRMIALCQEHHAKAAAFSVEQCREMKRAALTRTAEVAGRFDWMKRDVATVAGGNTFYNNTYEIAIDGRPFLWFNEDDERHRLLNIRFPPGPDGQERTSLVDNDWVLRGDPVDVKSPPNGAELQITYGNDDHLHVRFRAVSAAAPLKEYRYQSRQLASLAPEWHTSGITVVEVNLRLHFTTADLVLSPTGLWLGRDEVGGGFQQCVCAYNAIGMGFDIAGLTPVVDRRG